MKIVLDWAIPALSIASLAVIIGLPLLWHPPRDNDHQSVTGVDFYECGCSVVMDAEVATLLRCPAHEAMAEVERLTDGSER